MSSRKHCTQNVTQETAPFFLCPPFTHVRMIIASVCNIFSAPKKAERRKLAKQPLKEKHRGESSTLQFQQHVQSLAPMICSKPQQPLIPPGPCPWNSFPFASRAFVAAHWKNGWYDYKGQSVIKLGLMEDCLKIHWITKSALCVTLVGSVSYLVRVVWHLNMFPSTW